MAIERSKLSGIDFKDVATGRRLKPVHPGEVLMREFIEPLELTRYRTAKHLGIQQRRLDEICSGDRALTADTALRLGRLFGVEAQFWMNLQAQYDLEIAERGLRKKLDAEVTPLPTAA